MKRLDKQLKLLNNERGIALIMGIILILAISLFGMIGMTITTREIRGAGANRLSEQRFYEAQMGITEALLRPNELLTDNFLTQPVATAQGPPLAIIDPSDGTPLANVIIETVQNLDPATAALRGLPLMSHTGPPPNGYSVDRKSVV